MPSHYNYIYRGIKLDPYRIAEIYGITNHPQFQALKKILRAGRGLKDLEQDIDETIIALERWKEMLEEASNSTLKEDKLAKLNSLRTEAIKKMRKPQSPEEVGLDSCVTYEGEAPALVQGEK